MRTLLAVLVIALFAATSAAADTDTTTTADAAGQQALAQVQQELQQAAEPVQAAQSNTATTVAASPLAEAQAELAQAQACLTPADGQALSKTLRDAQGAYVVAGQPAEAAQGQLEALRKAVAELSKSGDLSAGGAEKLNKLMDELAQRKEARVYSLQGLKSVSVPFAYTMPGGGLNVGQLEERLKALQDDTQALQQRLDKLQELEQSGKLGQLEQLGKQQQDLFESMPRAQVFQMQPDTDGMKWLQGGAQAGQYKVLDLSGAGSSHRMLVLKFNADGGVDVSGNGFSADELDQIREQVKGQTGTIKLTVPGAQGEMELVRPDGGKGEVIYIMPDSASGAAGVAAISSPRTDDSDASSVSSSN
jgi:hypothetical protein